MADSTNAILSSVVETVAALVVALRDSQPGEQGESDRAERLNRVAESLVSIHSRLRELPG